MFSTKVNGPEVLSSASDKAELLTETFSKNSNLDDPGLSLPVFSSTTNLKLRDSVTTEMVKKVTMTIDLSKRLICPDWIPVVVLNNLEPELSCISAELLNKSLKESCFLD